MNHKRQLRQQVATYLRGIAESDIRAGKRPMAYAQQPETTKTGRYISLRLDLGLDNSRLLKLLSDDAILNQLLPWDIGSFRPQCYLDRKRIVVEAPLPPPHEFDVRLRSLTESRHNGHVAVLGPNERGVKISLGLEDVIHVLIGGATGSGKTFTLRSLAYQLANGDNQVVLVDGKRGDGLGVLNGLPGQIGPVATDRQATLNALGYVYDEMNIRYEAVQNRDGRGWRDSEIGAPPHLLVFFDEFQAYRDDVEIMTTLHGLAAMGRSARVHLFAGTQRPTVKMFGRDVGGATRAQFGFRIAHSVSDYDSSKSIVGGSQPRADYLMPKGDAYVIGSALKERVQIAYVPEDDLYRYTRGGVSELDHWPRFDTAKLGGESSVGRPQLEFSNEQIACGIYATAQGWGRELLQRLLDECGVAVPGSEPADRLKVAGGEIGKLLRFLIESNRSI